MRKFQKVTACIMAAALAATGCSGAGGAKAPAEPAKTEAAGTQADSGTQEDSGAQAAASGEEEPVLVVYTARSEALNNAVIPEFEKDTGIKVEVVVAGTGELLKRAQSERIILWAIFSGLPTRPCFLLPRTCSWNMFPRKTATCWRPSATIPDISHRPLPTPLS